MKMFKLFLILFTVSFFLTPSNSKAQSYYADDEIAFQFAEIQILIEKLALDLETLPSNIKRVAFFDLTYDKSIIAEFNFDNLNAIDYKKGCYVGQELTARTHYLGTIRKKLFYCQLKNTEELHQNTAENLVAETLVAETLVDYKNQEIKILLDTKEFDIGIALSSIQYNNSQHLLALLDCENSEDKNFYEKIMNNPIYLNNKILKIIN